MNNWKKLILTFFCGALFLWFWINGPINQSSNITTFISNQSEFLIPKFIEDEKLQNDKQYGLIDANKSTLKGDGSYGLLGRKKIFKSYALISDPSYRASMKPEIGEAIFERARVFRPILISNLKLALDMYYVEQEDGKGTIETLYFESTGLAENVHGYGGPISLGINVATTGKIEKIHYLGSEETSSYLSRIENSGFYQQFIGVDLDGKKHLIDAVSGASISTQAISETVSVVLQKAAESPLSLYLNEDSSGTKIDAILTNVWIVQISIITLLFFIYWQPWFKLTRKQSLVIKFITIITIGFYFNNSFTYASLVHPFLGVSVSSLVGFYCFLVIVGAIWDNNTYCKYICPFGNLQRIVTRLFPGLRRKFFLQSKIVKHIRTILSIIIISGFIIGQKQWASYELFPDLFGVELFTTGLVLALLSILISIFYPMIWCRLLCPTGEVLDQVSSIVSYQKIDILKSNEKIKLCTQCNNNSCANKNPELCQF